MKKVLSMILAVTMLLSCMVITVSADPETTTTSNAIDKYLYEPGNIMITGQRPLTGINYGEGLNGASALTWKNPTSDKLDTVNVYRIESDGTETDMSADIKTYLSEKEEDKFVERYAKTNTPGAAAELIETHADASAQVKYRLVFTFNDGQVRNIIYTHNYASVGGIQVFGADSSSTKNVRSIDSYGTYDMGPLMTHSGNTTEQSPYSMKPKGMATASSEKAYSGKASLKFESNIWPKAYNTKTSAWEDRNGDNVIVNALMPLKSGASIVQGTKYKLSMMVNTMEATLLYAGWSWAQLPNTNGEWQEYTMEFSYGNTSDNFPIKTPADGAPIREVYIDDIKLTSEDGSTVLFEDDFERSGYTTLAAAPSVAADLGDESAKITFSNLASGYNWVNVYEKLSDGSLALRARVHKDDGSVTLNNLTNDKEYEFVVKGQMDYNVGGNRGFETEGATVKVTPGESELMKRYAYEPNNIMITGTSKAVTFDDNHKGATALTWRNPESDDLSEVNIYRIGADGETDVTTLAKAYKYSDNQKAYCDKLATPGAMGKLTEMTANAADAVKYRLKFTFKDGTVKDIIYAGTASTGQTGYVYLGTKSLTETKTDGSTEYKGHGDFWATSAYGVLKNGADTVYTNEMKSMGLPTVSSSVKHDGKLALKFSSNEWAYDMSAADTWSENSKNNPTNVMIGVPASTFTAGQEYYISMYINTLESFNFKVCSNTVTIPNTNGKWYLFEKTLKWNSGSSFHLQRNWPDTFREFYVDDINVYSDSTKTNKIWSEDFEIKGYESLHTAPSLGSNFGTDWAEITWSGVNDSDTYVNVYEKLSDGSLALRARVNKNDGKVKFNNLTEGTEYNYVVKSAMGDAGSGRGIESEAAEISVTPAKSELLKRYEFEPSNMMITGKSEKANKFYDENNELTLEGASRLSWRNPESDTLSGVKVYRMNDDGSETDMTTSVKAYKYSVAQKDFVDITTPGAIGTVTELHKENSGSVKYRLVFNFSNGMEKEVIYAGNIVDRGVGSIYNSTNSGDASFWGKASYGPKGNSGSADSYMLMKCEGRPTMSSATVHGGKSALKFSSNEWVYGYNEGTKSWDEQGGNTTNILIGMASANINSAYKTEDNKLKAPESKKYYLSMWINTIESFEFRIQGDSAVTDVAIPNTNGEWKEFGTYFSCPADVAQFNLRRAGKDIFRDFYIDDLAIYTDDTKGTKVWSEDFEMTDYDTLHAAPTGVSSTSGKDWVEISWDTAIDSFINVYEKNADNSLTLRAKVLTGDKKVKLNVSNVTEDKTITYVVKSARPEENTSALARGFESEAATTTVTVVVPEYEVVDNGLAIDGEVTEFISTGGTYTGTAKVVNNKIDDGITAQLIVAEYSGSELVNVYLSEAKTVAKGSNETLTTPAGTAIKPVKGHTYKVMVWKGIESATPLATGVYYDKVGE